MAGQHRVLRHRLILGFEAANADVTIDFQPSFRNVLDLTATPPTCSGFGITINNDNGEVRVPPPPSTATTIHNFLLHATAEDSSDDKEYRISVRIHLHNRITSAWLTPPILTLRPNGPTLPQLPFDLDQRERQLETFEQIKAGF